VEIDVLGTVVKTFAEGEAKRETLNLKASKHSRWTREQKIGVVTIVLAVGAIIVAFTVPEIRKIVGLDKPTPAATPTAGAASVTPDARTAPQPKASSLPASSQSVKPKSRPIVSQHSNTLVAGNNNAGNNVSGNGNVVGAQQIGTASNSPNVGSVTQGPGSIAQIGGNGNTAIIGVRYKVLSDTDIGELSKNLATKPGKVRIETRNASNDTLNCSSRLWTAFGKGLWSVAGNNTTAPPDMDDNGPIVIPSGIQIYPNEGKESVAKFVQEQLKVVGLDSRIGTGRPVEPLHGEDIELFVGAPE
jgi:hypothetical protein